MLRVWPSNRTAFLSALALLVAVAVSADPPAGFYPKLRNDAQKLAFLLYVREYVPSLFEQAARYDMGLFAILDDEKTLARLLANSEEYKKAVKERPPFLELTAATKTVSKVTTIRIDPAAVSSWKLELQEALSAIPKDAQVAQSAIETRIFESIQAVGGRSSAGMMTGLIQALPADLKGRAFRAGPEERLQILSESLPDPLPGSFKASAYGLGESPSRAQAIAAMRKLAAEERLQLRLIELHAVLQDANHKIPGSVSELPQRIEALNEERLGFLADADALAPRVSALETTLKRRDASASLRDATPRLSEHVRAYSSRTVTETEELKGGIRLSEPPPGVALFRGCVGGDCSTQLSFPYPNDPHERVFFIYGEDGRIKGYLAGTVVKTGRKKAFYVHTVNGPRLSASDTELALQAVYQARSKLGVEQILLVRSEKHEALLNFPPVRGVFARHVQGRAAVPIQHLGPKTRKVIQTFPSEHNTGEYDALSEHTEAVPFAPERSPPGVTVEIGQVVPMAAKDFQLDRAELLQFALDLHYSGRTKDARRVRTLGGITTQDFRALIAVLDNKAEHATAQLNSEAQKSLRQMGLSGDLLERRPGFLAAGQLRAPDRLAPENLDLTAKAVVSLMDAYDPVSKTRSEKVLKEVLPKIQSHPIIQHYVDTLVDGSPERVEFLTFLKPLGLEPTPAQIQRLAEKMANPEYQHALLHTLGQHFMSENETFIQGCVRLMSSPDDKLRLYAVRSLGDIAVGRRRKGLGTDGTLLQSDEVISAILGVAKGPTAQERQVAFWVLGEIKPHKPEQLQSIATALQDESKEVREAVAKALAAISAAHGLPSNFAECFSTTAQLLGAP